MINVGIEISPLNNQNKYRGIGVYVSCLIDALKKTKKINVFEIFDLQIPQNINLIHYPYFDFFFLTLPLKKNIKTLITIHDCIPLVFPKQFSAGIRGKIKLAIQKYSLKNVSAVITDSESSKKDIIKFLKVPEEKINVVYLAADDIYRKIEENDLCLKTTALKYGLNKDFLLYVNDVNYNKNLIGLLKAFSKIDANCDLVLVGKAFENNNLPEVSKVLELIKELNIQSRVKILGFVPKENLVYLYNLAKVYCHPSFYEGFGLQILEAMACGCPVVTSNISSMPEVVGEAGILVNPNDIDSITNGINKALNDNNFKNIKIKLGFDQVKKFSWKKVAEETIKVYEKILEE